MFTFLSILWKCIKIPFRLLLSLLDGFFLVVKWIMIGVFVFMFFMTQG